MFIELHLTASHSPTRFVLINTEHIISVRPHFSMGRSIGVRVETAAEFYECTDSYKDVRNCLWGYTNEPVPGVGLAALTPPEPWPLSVAEVDEAKEAEDTPPKPRGRPKKTTEAV